MVRKAFTLIELLVVIVIIGILVSLTMPALNAARAAARKIQCTNNMKQFGLAFANFEAMNGGYPPSRTRLGGASWTLALLDFLELRNISADYDKSKEFCDGVDNQLLMRKQVSLFQCPATPKPTRLQNLTKALDTPVTDVTSSTSTTNAQGTCTDYYVHMGNITQIDGRTFSPPLNSQCCQRILTPVSDITDGLANTIIMAEMAGRPERWADGKRDSTFNSSFAYSSSGSTKDGECANRPWWSTWGGNAVLQLSAFSDDGQTPWLDSKTKENCTKIVNATNDGIYSFHPSGANALFLDGSVKFVSERVIPDVYLAMSAKNSGEPFTLADLEITVFSSLYRTGDPSSMGR